MKILHWNHNGFWLFYRGLEEGVFDWPNDSSSQLKITGRQFKWPLEGLPMYQKTAYVQVSAKVEYCGAFEPAVRMFEPPVAEYYTTSKFKANFIHLLRAIGMLKWLDIEPRRA